MSRVSPEIELRRSGAVGFFAGDRRLRRVGVDAFGEVHPRLDLALVGAFDRVLVVLALHDQPADADHGHGREQGKGDREADPEAVGKRRTEATGPAGICLRGDGGRGYRPRRRLRRGGRRDRRRGRRRLVRRARPALRPPLTYERIAGGHSNLTYRVADAAGSEWALRRPPLGKTLSSAHDMAREHRVVAALGGTPVRSAGRRPLRGRVGERRALLRHGVRPRAVLRGVAEAEASFPDEGERPRSACASPTRSPTSTPSTPTRSASATSAARRTTSPASCAAGTASGRSRRRASSPRSTASTTVSPPASRRRRASRSSTATIASTT